MIFDNDNDFKETLNDFEILAVNIHKNILKDFKKQCEVNKRDCNKVVEGLLQSYNNPNEIKPPMNKNKIINEIIAFLIQNIDEIVYYEQIPFFKIFMENMSNIKMKLNIFGYEMTKNTKYVEIKKRENQNNNEIPADGRMIKRTPETELCYQFLRGFEVRGHNNDN